MGMLLGLLHKLGLDLLSSGNLGEHVSVISRWWVREDWRALLPASDEDILGSHRPGPCIDSEHPPAHSTAAIIMNNTVRKSRAVNLLWRTLASTRSTGNDLGSRLRPRMRFREDMETYRRCS